MSDDKYFMTSKEVCRYCNISISVLNKLERDGNLKPNRKLPINHRRLYTKEDVDKFLDSISTNQD